MDSLFATDEPDQAAVLDRAIQDHQAGRIPAAEAAYLRILRHDPVQTDALHLLGMLACDRGDIQIALDLIDAAIDLEPVRAAFHNTRARALTVAGRLDQAEAAYRTAWTLRPDAAEIANNLGCLLRDRGDAAGAVAWFRRALDLAPGSADVAGNLADVLAATGAQAESLLLFQQAVRLAPHAADIHSKFAPLLLALGRLEQAEQCYRVAIRSQPGHAASHNNLGLVLQAKGCPEAAMQSFRDALLCDPRCADAQYNLGCVLLLDDRLDEARTCHDLAIEADPLHGKALWARCMVELPVLYASVAQIAVQRQRYGDQLQTLTRRADDPAVAQALAAAVGASQPFFLPYQGACDRDLQIAYGALVARVLQTAMPAETAMRTETSIRAEAPTRIDAPALADAPVPGEPIRLGIVSGFFCEHTIWRLMLKGWLSQLDRRRFSVHAYHTGSVEDAQTAVARTLCARFVGGAGVDLRSAILADRPHVLLYPEVGMDPAAVRLAAQRLAPLQCVSWGQPDTSGLPTLDVFLSSVLMEPQGAASHYSEALVSLPNLGIHYSPDERQAEHVSRADLGLRDGATAFWCGQALYKYLPQYDDVFARIAAAVPDSQFVFIGFAKSRTVTAAFHARLRQAFAARGLDGERHCVLLDPMSQERFLGTIRVSDIVLDSIGWSGGKSTLDALAEAPVIVTYAAPLMRGRHTMAILTGIGVTETIAASIDDYVRIAIRLAHDPVERRTLRARIAAGRHRVIADTAPIRALEAFLIDAVAAA